MSHRLAIVGSRSGIELGFVEDYIRGCDPAEYVIVSGGARGVDRTAVEFARGRGMQTVEHEPYWKVDKLAGKRRNWRLVNDCDSLVAFWDGWSNGTAHAVAAAVRMGKQVAVFSPERIITDALNERKPA